MKAAERLSLARIELRQSFRRRSAWRSLMPAAQRISLGLWDAPVLPEAATLAFTTQSNGFPWNFQRTTGLPRGVTFSFISGCGSEASLRIRPHAWVLPQGVTLAFSSWLELTAAGGVNALFEWPKPRATMALLHGLERMSIAGEPPFG